MQVLDSLFPVFTEFKNYTLGEQELVWDVGDAIDHSTQFRIVTTAGSAAEHDIDIVITAIKVEGDGDNPFDVPDNC